MLKIAVIGPSELKTSVLFETNPVRQKKRGIPFMYSWDGAENLVLLTRVEGQNTIYHLWFQVRATRARVLQTKKLLTVSYPEILGAPALSSNSRYVSWIHLNKASERVIEIYDLKTKKIHTRLKGGGDTSKIPCWSSDNQNLFFLSQDQKGIIVYNIKGRQYQQNFGKEIYGRYLSCSPNGRYLSFFQRSDRGKGRVHLCLWQWKKKNSKVIFLQQNIVTKEQCNPSWSKQGRFVAIIHSGPQEKVVIQDTISRTLFTIFRRQGKVNWIDWAHPDALSFTYQEGLFTRPYRVRFTSLFMNH